MSEFFIKEGYQSNSVRLTMDNLSGGNYWTKTRIYNSRFFQYGVYKKALEIIEKKNEVKCLIDVGCGSGEKLKLISSHFPKLEILGIDQKNAIEYCRKTYDFAQFFVDDFEDPQPYNFKGDIIICADVIEHVLNPDLLIEYLKNFLAPHGKIILSTPERDLLHGKDNNKPKNKNHIREWNSAELALYLQSRSLNIEEHFYQYPIKLGFNKLMRTEIINRIVKGKNIKYNQVVVCSFNKDDKAWKM